MNKKEAAIVIISLAVIALLAIVIAISADLNKPKGETRKSPFSFSRELVKNKVDKQAPF